MPIPLKPKSSKRPSLLIALILIVGLLLPAIPAQAIVGSTTAGAGAYPFVGGVWKIKESGLPNDASWKKLERVRANGILIAGNVVLTEGGSFRNGDRVAVSFASPIPQSDLKNPPYQGYIFQDPEFNFLCPEEYTPETTWCGPVHDAAVVILDQIVAGIEPQSLPAIGTLEEVDLTAVSYGPTTVDPGKTDFTRRISEEWGLLEPVPGQPASAVRFSVPDNGLTCFGDTGGPVLQESDQRGDIVALIQSWFPVNGDPTPEGICGEGNPPTPGVAYGYRLDTAETYQFLCMVHNTDFATVEVENPIHPGQNVPYATPDPSLKDYCPENNAARGVAADDVGSPSADTVGNQTADRQHKHKSKHRKGGNNRQKDKHRR